MNMRKKVRLHRTSLSHMVAHFFLLVQLQLVEMQNLGKTLAELETSHLKIKRKYEDEITSLKRIMSGKTAEKGNRG
jgi:hypothetical protein